MSFIDDLKKGAITAATSVAADMAKEAEIDAIEFVKLAAPSISDYFFLYNEKKITEAEFHDLMKGLLVLAKMSGLTLAQVAAIKIDETRNAVLRAVTSIALGTVDKLL